MKNGKLDNRHNSGISFRTRQQLLSTSRSERLFLTDQAVDAKAAMIQTLHDIKESLMKAADVRHSAKQHPWITVGVAASAAFITGAALTGSRQKRIKKNLSKLKADVASNCHVQGTMQTKHSFLFSTLSAALAGIVKTAIHSFIAASVVANGQPAVPVAAPDVSPEPAEPESEF